MNKYNRTLVLAATAITTLGALPVTSMGIGTLEVHPIRPLARRSHSPNRGGTSPTCRAEMA